MNSNKMLKSNYFLGLLIPITFLIQLEQNAIIYLTDFMMIILFLFYTFNFRSFPYIPSSKKIIFLYLLWIITAVVSSLVNQIDFLYILKGFALIFISFISYFNFHFIFGNNLALLKKTLLFLFISYSFYPLFYSDLQIIEFLTYWKFYFGMTFAFVLIYLLRKKSLIFIFILIILNLFLGFRSLSLILTVTMLLGLFAHHNNKDKNFFSRVIKVILFCIITIFFIVIFSHIYDFILNSEFLTNNLKTKYIQQSSGKLGTIFGGRSEILVSLQAFLDSPFLGHGAWAQNCEYQNIYKQNLYLLHYNINTDFTDLGCFLPSHSYLFDNLLSGGLLSGLFWIYVIYLSLNVIYLELFNMNDDFILIFFICCFLIYSILFSPFGSFRRFEAPLIIYFLINYRNLYNVKF